MKKKWLAALTLACLLATDVSAFAAEADNGESTVFRKKIRGAAEKAIAQQEKDASDKRKTEGKNPRMTYFFDIEKCKRCPYKAGCYKEGAKKKTYTETLVCDSHSEQAQFQETAHFKEMAKERYKIEAKNSELKHRHGYDVASSSGLIGMEMQGAMTIFAVNLKRIIKLISEK